MIFEKIVSAMHKHKSVYDEVARINALELIDLGNSGSSI
jgi:hypothetical protein